MNEELLLAQLDEANALIEALRKRTVQLNAEVRLRDQKIQQLTEERDHEAETP